MLREHELRLGLPEGTFWRGVQEPGAADTIPVRRGLELAKELAEAELDMSGPPTPDPGYAPAIIRICCATVVGAAVGAPLGALAIHENVLKKMVEAAIVTGLGAVAAEIAGPLSELARLHHQPPTEPARPPRSTAIGAVIDHFLHPDKAPHGQPELDDNLTAKEAPPKLAPPPDSPPPPEQP